jgi:hypothetical protein
LPLAIFEFNTLEKTLERMTLVKEWNLEGLLLAAGFGEDDFNQAALSPHPLALATDAMTQVGEG